MVSAGTPPAAVPPAGRGSWEGPMCRLACPGARGKKRDLRGPWTVREGNLLIGTNRRAPACRTGPLGTLLGAHTRRAERRVSAFPSYLHSLGRNAVRAALPEPCQRASGPWSHQPPLSPKGGPGLRCSAVSPLCAHRSPPAKLALTWYGPAPSPPRPAPAPAPAGWSRQLLDCTLSWRPLQLQPTQAVYIRGSPTHRHTFKPGRGNCFA